MALALRLRRALAAAATSSSALLRPATASSRSIPLPFPAVLPRPLWPRLPAGSAGFRSTSAAAAAARGGDYGGEDSKISPDEILFEGCDYNHWLITMEFPDPKPSREEMIETYLQTLAKVVGSYEEAKKRMYALSTTTYIGFQAVMTEEMSEKFRGLPGVVFILPDSYLYPETKEYGGDKYDNGVITPRPPPVHYSKPSRNDRNRNYRGNYQNNPQRGNYQNNPQQGNYQNYPPQQGDGRGFAPQQNYAPAGQDGRGYGRNDYGDHRAYNTPPGGYQDDRRGPAPQYQGNANPGGQGQGYYNPPQGPAGDFRPGGPSAPGNYGPSSGTGYPGANQGVPGYGSNAGYKPGVNSGYGGDSRQGTGPADNWQGAGSGQHPSPGEGQQGNWQGRQ